MASGDDERIKVFRVLVYEGKRKDIEGVLAMSHVRPLVAHGALSIAELVCTELPTGTIVGVPLPETNFAKKMDEDFGRPRLIKGEKK